MAARAKIAPARLTGIAVQWVSRRQVLVTLADDAFDAVRDLLYPRLAPEIKPHFPACVSAETAAYLTTNWLDLADHVSTNRR